MFCLVDYQKKKPSTLIMTTHCAKMTEIEVVGTYCYEEVKQVGTLLTAGRSLNDRDAHSTHNNSLILDAYFREIKPHAL